MLVHPVFERVFHTYDALNNVVDENLQGIRVVKSYNRESFEVSKFGRISQRIFKDFTKAERIMSFNSPLMMICIYGSMILIAWMGAQQIVASGNNPAVGLTTGDLTANAVIYRCLSGMVYSCTGKRKICRKLYDYCGI